MRPKYLKARDYYQNNPEEFNSQFEQFLTVETAEDYVIIGDGIEVPSNGNIIKTKPGSRSKGRENRTKNIRKKITGAMKRKKPDFLDEDWI